MFIYNGNYSFYFSFHGDSSTNSHNPPNSGNGPLPLAKEKSPKITTMAVLKESYILMHTSTLLCKTFNSLGKTCEKPNNQVSVFSSYKEK